jgi:hypothetical protein
MSVTTTVVIDREAGQIVLYSTPNLRWTSPTPLVVLSPDDALAEDLRDAVGMLFDAEELAAELDTAAHPRCDQWAEGPSGVGSWVVRRR